MAKVLQQALQNYKRGMRKRDYPACTTEKEFHYWTLLEAESRTQPIRRFYCRDCSVAYKEQMVAAGRCYQSDVNIEKIID